MPITEIVVSGAREHNLKNIHARIPLGSVTVVTGLSGSGKSSLAFDTLYAEGQRRYVESLSAYARQFLNQLQKPDVDHIEGLAPAIAIEQRTAGSNPRSIVATTTEIYDYLRLLYAHIGKRHCPSCGKAVTRQTAQEIVDQLMTQPKGTKLSILAPLVRGQKGAHEEPIEAVRKKGFLRLRVDGQVVDLEHVPALAKSRKHDLDVVIDRIAISERGRGRLSDSVELALEEGDGVLIALLQKSKGPDSELLFSENYACVPCGLSFEELEARHFSFNSPYGACPRCSGLGTHLVFDEDLVVPDPSLPLDKGALKAWKTGGRRMVTYFNGLLRAVAKHHGIEPSTKWSDLPASFRKIVLHGSGDEEIEFTLWRGGKHHRYRKPFEGVIPNLQRREEESKSEYMRQRLRSYMNREPCPDCGGRRLRRESLACTVDGVSVIDFIERSIESALAFIDGLELDEQAQQVVGEVAAEIRQRLTFMARIGLGYLTLNRESGSLSGGEAQRIRLATQIGAGLVGVLYVLDEPSIGLHQRDNQRLIATLQQLRDVGNTVVVVEHDEETIRAADHVLDLGPGAGRHGGEIVSSGTVEDLMANPRSLTGRYLAGREQIPVPKRLPPHKGCLQILGAAQNNLQDLDVEIPLRLFVCVTGVSGSGKSTLVEDILSRALFRHFYKSKERPGTHRELNGLDQLDKVVRIDQSPIGRTPRSNPATYTGAFTHIRKLLSELPDAKVRGYGPGRFSFNVKGGRCETCKGDGILRLEMHFLPDVYVECEACRGRRYNEETLQIRYGGRSIADMLEMTVDEALEFFRNIPAIHSKLATLSDVGLGYLQLGQSATTLSGGEAQRVKLASELSKRGTGNTLYLLDEPTTGLHFADVQRLLHVLQRLRDAGNTILVIEHNLDVIKCADYILDLGPEGGDGGGQIVAAGTPEEIAACPGSHTGQFLRTVLAARAAESGASS